MVPLPSISHSKEQGSKLATTACCISSNKLETDVFQGYRSITTILASKYPVLPYSYFVAVLSRRIEQDQPQWRSGFRILSENPSLMPDQPSVWSSSRGEVQPAPQPCGDSGRRWVDSTGLFLFLLEPSLNPDGDPIAIRLDVYA